MDNQIIEITLALFVILTLSSLITIILKKLFPQEKHRKILSNLENRVKSWWTMIAVFSLTFIFPKIGSIILFYFISIMALREMVTIAKSTVYDHRTLAWIFFVITPLQYYLIYIQWYGLFSILIPVYGYLLIPFRSVLRGQYYSFLERISQIQWAVFISVYCISHVPALLSLNIPNYNNAKLLLILTLIVQLSDVFQYVWGIAIGKNKVSPTISPNKTWEGLIGGVITASLIGSALSYLAPYSYISGFFISLTVCIIGFVGDLTMSAIKRDVKLKDFSTLIPGHGGMMDRMDSISFAAPVFFHIVRYYYT